jgi:hypothetical protein
MHVLHNEAAIIHLVKLAHNHQYTVRRDGAHRNNGVFRRQSVKFNRSCDGNHRQEKYANGTPFSSHV